MSELPNGWRIAHLEELCDWSSGGTPRRSEPTYFGGEVPWITISDLNDGLITKTAERLTEIGIANSAAKLVPKGTVLVALYGSIGKLGITSEPSTTNQAIACALPDSRAFDSLYLFHFLRARRQELASQGTGVTQKNIYLGDIKGFSAPIAPRNEQTRIVDKLEELLSDLDAGVAELKAAQKKRAQYRQSLLKAAVEGALTAEWRQQHPPAETGAQLLQRILAERRARWEAKQLAKFKEQGKTPPRDWQKKYPEPVQPDTSDLPELPQGWVWAKVEMAGEVQLGRQRAPQFHRGENMVPYLRVANVFEERIDVSDVMEMHFSEEDEATFMLSPGDVLLNEGQSLELVGRPAIYRGELPRACFTNTLVRFRAENGVLGEYALAVFLHYMHSGRFRKIAKITTNIAHLGAGRFAELEFPLPPLSEQTEVVRLLHAATEELQRQGVAVALALKQSTAQRQNILRAAFAGQLVPQDPTDEPASVLLERIRAERANKDKLPKTRKTKQAKEVDTVMKQLVEVLTEEADWLPAQEAFRRCGVADGAATERIEELYSELRKLAKSGRLAVESVTDENGSKLYDKLRLLGS